jgi:hypothetical protein
MPMLGSLLLVTSCTRTQLCPFPTANRSQQPVETIVSIAPHSVATAAVANESDSFTMLMAVCVGFWVISATVSAGIGAVMRLAGMQLQGCRSTGLLQGGTGPNALSLGCALLALGTGAQSVQGSNHVSDCMMKEAEGRHSTCCVACARPAQAPSSS